MMSLRVSLAIALMLLVASPAAADWLDDYEAGLKAAQNAQWEVVVQKMTSAIRSKPRENARERTTGTGFIAYHPYYYRGLAQLELGRLDAAIEDLKKATGQGTVKLGAPDSLIARAEMQLARQRQPEPAPTTTVAQQQPPPQTPPPTTTAPAQPAVDPNLAPARDRARQTLSRASSAMQQAQNARAASQPEFSDAQRLLLEAQQAAASADTAADWSAVARTADRAISTFDLARTRAQIAQQPPAKAPAAKVAQTATEDALAPKRQQVRAAVEAYFSGDFARSIQAFQRLTSEDSDNALLWAFLGASHYYNWYLDGQANAREEQAAIEAFRRAKQYGNGRLDGRYFPKRVQDFFATVRVR